MGRKHEFGAPSFFAESKYMVALEIKRRKKWRRG